MLKLIGYEFRKSWIAKAILLGITALLEVVYVVGLLTSDEATITIAAALLFMIATSGILVIGLMSVVVLHRDMNTRQGYMLFMTPNSCYKILGAKVLENGLSILVAGAFFTLLGALDVTLLFGHYNRLDELWQMAQKILTSMVPGIRLENTVLILFVGWATTKLGEAKLFKDVETLFIWSSVIDLALAGLMYWLTALVMERRLSV